MEKITMGSCQLYKGESYDYVLEQLQRMAAMHVTEYYFDVICLPTQLKEATRIVDYFYDTLHELLPWIHADHVYVGITCDGMERPAGACLAIKMKAKDAEVSMLDVNPGRP